MAAIRGSTVFDCDLGCVDVISINLNGYAIVNRFQNKAGSKEGPELNKGGVKKYCLKIGIYGEVPFSFSNYAKYKEDMELLR